MSGWGFHPRAQLSLDGAPLQFEVPGQPGASVGMINIGAWDLKRAGNMLDGGAPFYGVYDTADGQYVTIGSLEPQFYAALIKHLDLKDPRFANQWDRAMWPDLRATLDATFTKADESQLRARRDSLETQIASLQQELAGAAVEELDARADEDVEVEVQQVPAVPISACRLVGFKMTLAKLSVFVLADGTDALEPQIPLIRIIGTPTKQEDMARVETGQPYVTVRAAYHDWKAVIRIRYDADQFTLQDVSNLMARVGLQVGIGEGRPDSKNSAGMGWGMFTLEEAA